MQFRHEVIDAEPPCGQLGICRTTDLTGNGRPDVIVGGLGPSYEFDLFGRTIYPRDFRVVGDVLSRFETNLFWYENPGWKRHAISTTPDLFLFGNDLGDIDGDGRLDLVVGQGYAERDIYWYRRPNDPRRPWQRHLVSSAFDMYHDLAVGDVDNDGDPEVVGLSQRSETVFYYDIPPDPTVEPWPEEYLHVVADDTNVEGVAIADLDGDGDNELVAGTGIYNHAGNGEWDCETVVTGWDWTRVAVADLDDDGDPELVFTEGDSPHLGTRPGRVAWFDPPDWEEHLLRDDMFCPHTVQIADFDGNGRPDIYVAEMGLGKNDDPEHVLFRNRGAGEFEEEVIFRGIPTHEARAVDLTGDGRPDIVGKSYTPEHHVDVWYNEG